MNVNKLRGEIVAQYRTQRAFAEQIGWHQNKMSKLMTGKYKPDTDDIAAIMQALQLSEHSFCDIFMPEKSPNGDFKVEKGA